MPTVKGKKYPYTPSGMRAAKLAGNKSGQQAQSPNRNNQIEFQKKINSLSKRFGELSKRRQPLGRQTFSNARNQNAGMPIQMPKGPQSIARMNAPRGTTGRSFSGSSRTRGLGGINRFQPGEAPSIRNRGGSRAGRLRSRGSGGSRRMGTPGMGRVLTGRKRRRF